ncbi:MAG: family ATPase, partial [Herbinix sp.]|nr:family ATPase [Herbinix sp.]
LEEFNKAKVNLLSDKINAHFKVVKWKLFERQINGGYNPICEPLVNGQAYSSALNSGHKILAELDIIQALQRIYDVSVPVFLDNSERINDFNVPAMDCQLITLSVTEDQFLKVEVA